MDSMEDFEAFLESAAKLGLVPNVDWKEKFNHLTNEVKGAKVREMALRSELEKSGTVLIEQVDASVGEKAFQEEIRANPQFTKKIEEAAAREEALKRELKKATFDLWCEKKTSLTKDERIAKLEAELKLKTMKLQIQASFRRSEASQENTPSGLAAPVVIEGTVAKRLKLQLQDSLKLLETTMKSSESENASNNATPLIAPLTPAYKKHMSFVECWKKRYHQEFSKMSFQRIEEEKILHEELDEPMSDFGFDSASDISLRRYLNGRVCVIRKKLLELHFHEDTIVQFNRVVARVQKDFGLTRTK